MLKRLAAALTAAWLCLAAPACADPATNFALLPLITATATTSQDGDGQWQIAFQTGSPAAPIDLTGIAFTLQWHPASGGTPNTVVVSLSAGQYLANGGPTGILSLSIPRDRLRVLPAGTYVASLVASLGTSTVDLGLVTITHTALGPSSVTSLTAAPRNAATATSIGYIPGPQGLSAYQVAVANGFPGTQPQWLASLVGAPGAVGPQGAAGAAGAQGAAGSNATVALVPSRTATGSGTAATTSADYLVVVKGPTAVTLETAPPNGTTHVIKLGSGTSLTIIPGGSDTIDGAASVAFTNAFQAATFTYTTGAGWSVY